jgi:predicted AAA+ superfamily ATPase
MIERRKTSELIELIDSMPAVALLGPRQAGKTTLAQGIGEGRKAHYLDLESDTGRARLADPEAYLAEYADHLVILDEVQRMPGLFQNLRGLIDQGRRKGMRSGRFLLLGSASIELLRQSSESLAGRIAYTELGPFDALEVDDLNRLWLRGGFPDSYLAASDRASARWRRDLIRTYLERDIPQLGPRIAAETLRRFWTMLAHAQSGLLNASSLARSLGVDGKTIASYLDLLVDLLLVRRLEPWHGNVKKRLVKSPRVYIRDSGLVHSLLQIEDRETLLGHPILGASWEGFVIENAIMAAPDGTKASFYRTSAGAECDLVLELPGGEVWAVEIKRSTAPKVSKGFWIATGDVKATRKFVVYPGDEKYSAGNGVQVVSLKSLLEMLTFL